MQGTSTTSLSQETRDLELNLKSKYPQLSSPDAARQMLVSKCVARAKAAVVEKLCMAVEIRMAVERLIVEVEGSPNCDDKEGKDNVVVASTSSSGVATSSASSASGTLNFAVTNAGSETTEFYLLASDGLRIVGEVENIAPGASRTLTVLAQPGDYYTLCKPGMIGDGVGRAAFAVTGGLSAAVALIWMRKRGTKTPETLR